MGLKAWMFPPWVTEVVNFLFVGASSGWFGLACPAHCSSSLTLLGSVFLAGLSTGALGFAFFAWFVLCSHPSPAATVPPVSRRPPDLRLAAYLHERARSLD